MKETRTNKVDVKRSSAALAHCHYNATQANLQYDFEGVHGMAWQVMAWLGYLKVDIMI